jgi:cytochrome c oxidase assembly protein subunit 11
VLSLSLSALNARMLAKLIVITLTMFGFGYAMVPIYRSICEVTGVNSLTQVDEDAKQFAANTQVDASRLISIEFDANGRGAWQFKPRTAAIQAHPGELVTVEYELVNTLSREVQGQAIPSYAPQAASRWLRKLECFCFKQQTLGPNERRVFPVVFVVDPQLPQEVGTITLSYTFFEVGQPVPPAPRT